MNLILASTSPYRRILLEKLGMPFTCQSPQVDETPLPHESASHLVERLATAKANAVAVTLKQEALVIGSDQVASLEGDILGKPGSFEKAKQQLLRCSGHEVTFFTGICVANTKTATHETYVEQFSVKFKSLSEQQITGYLNKEEPFDCAGSFKSEGLGICLFQQLLGSDPNSLIGLPLIKLNEMLIKQGVDALLYQQ